MKLLKCRALSGDQKNEAASLVSLCRDFESIGLSFPVDDSDTYYLLYHNQNLISILSLFFPDLESCECYAFTHPDFRRKGLFSCLLSEALEDLEKREETAAEILFAFVTDGKSPDALHTLHEIGAQYWYSEYMMSLSLKDGGSVGCKDESQEMLPLIFYQDHIAFPVHTGNLYGLLSSQDIVICHISNGQYSNLGSFMLTKTGEDTVYFFGFEIKENLQGKGFGKQVFSEVLRMLRQISVNHITLQVSEQNVAALSLYKKTGFHITETLSYYLY